MSCAERACDELAKRTPSMRAESSASLKDISAVRSVSEKTLLPLRSLRQLTGGAVFFVALGAGPPPVMAFQR